MYTRVDIRVSIYIYIVSVHASNAKPLMNNLEKSHAFVRLSRVIHRRVINELKPRPAPSLNVNTRRENTPISMRF